MCCHSCTHCLSVCILPPHLPHSPSPPPPALKSSLSTRQLLITLNFSLYFWSFSFICLCDFFLLLRFSLRLDLWPLFLFHCLPLSLSELSAQTVEYMSSKYTSPLSLHLNKLQQRERKREAVGQEEGRMGAQGGDKAWKKGNIQVKQHLHVQRLQSWRGAAIQSWARGGKHYNWNESGQSFCVYNCSGSFTV